MVVMVPEFAPPAHAATTLMVGKGLTVTVIVAVVAHCPALGVNVYVPVAVLLTVAGLHVPFTPLLELPGSVGMGVVPLQNAAICVNAGMVCALMVIFKEPTQPVTV